MASGGYPPLATNTEGNNFFSVYQTSRIKLSAKIDSEDCKKPFILLSSGGKCDLCCANKE